MKYSEFENEMQIVFNNCAIQVGHYDDNVIGLYILDEKKWNFDVLLFEIKDSKVQTRYKYISFNNSHSLRHLEVIKQALDIHILYRNKYIKEAVHNLIKQYLNI